MQYISNFQEENMKTPDASQGQSASELISRRIAELGDWRGETPSRMRKHAGIICTGESYKNVVKLTFSKGAPLKDPAPLFNSSLDGNTRRAANQRRHCASASTQSVASTMRPL